MQGGYTVKQLIPKPKEDGDGFDLVVLNPPYLPAPKYDTDSADSSWGGAKLDFMRDVIKTAHQLLNRDGVLLMLHSNTSLVLLNKYTSENPDICWEDLTPEGGHRVPLDLEEVYAKKSRVDYLKQFGLEERLSNKHYPYWHQVRVIAIYRKDNSLIRKDDTIFGISTILNTPEYSPEALGGESSQSAEEQLKLNSEDTDRLLAKGDMAHAKSRASASGKDAAIPQYKLYLLIQTKYLNGITLDDGTIFNRVDALREVTAGRIHGVRKENGRVVFYRKKVVAQQAAQTIRDPKKAGPYLEKHIRQVEEMSSFKGGNLGLKVLTKQGHP
ncbi:MAG: hypothetical protein Q8R48_03550, partial [Candidatus Omnitrophota bacterium]|nr:hypothetical protein [Candidatus Omnitrophota bacterium]